MIFPAVGASPLPRSGRRIGSSCPCSRGRGRRCQPIPRGRSRGARVVVAAEGMAGRVPGRDAVQGDLRVGAAAPGELIARGSASLTMPSCARCGRDGRPLFRTAGGSMCKPCAARVRTAACAHCGEVKAIAGRDAAGRCICERCRRRDRGHRRCGRCGREAPIAVRARDGAPDICVNCYRMPSAVCSGCGKCRPCNWHCCVTPSLCASGHDQSNPHWSYGDCQVVERRP